MHQFSTSLLLRRFEGQSHIPNSRGGEGRGLSGADLFKMSAKEQRRLEASRTGSKCHSPPRCISHTLFFMLKQTFTNLHSVMSRSSVLDSLVDQNLLSTNRFKHWIFYIHKFQTRSLRRFWRQNIDESENKSETGFKNILSLLCHKL